MAAFRLLGMPGQRNAKRGVARGRNWALLALLLSAGAVHAATFTGTIFEDANYGGGAGRARVASGGTVLSGVTVELYAVTGGALIATTTTNGSGFYSLSSGVSAASMIVRVVNGTVRSARTGGVACGQPERLRAVLVAALADELEHAVARPPGIAPVPQPFVERAEAHLVLRKPAVTALHSPDSTPIQIGPRGV